jgi:hypothetical protein
MILPGGVFVVHVAFGRTAILFHIQLVPGQLWLPQEVFIDDWFVRGCIW